MKLMIIFNSSVLFLVNAHEYKGDVMVSSIRSKQRLIYFPIGSF